MGNAKVVVGVRLLKVSLTSYGHSLLQRPRASSSPVCAVSFSDLIRPFAIATETSAFQQREMESFSDLIRPFAIATLSGPAGSGDTQYVSVTSYGHSLLQLSVVAHYRR